MKRRMCDPSDTYPDTHLATYLDTDPDAYPTTALLSRAQHYETYPETCPNPNMLLRPWFSPKTPLWECFVPSAQTPSTARRSRRSKTASAAGCQYALRREFRAQGSRKTNMQSHTARLQEENRLCRRPNRAA